MFHREDTKPTKISGKEAEGGGFHFLRSAFRLLPSALFVFPALLFLAVFFFLPLIRILVTSLDASVFTAVNLQRALEARRGEIEAPRGVAILATSRWGRVGASFCVPPPAWSPSPMPPATGARPPRLAIFFPLQGRLIEL